MTGSVFDEKRAPPDEAALTHALGETKPLWDALIGHVAERCDGLEPEWKYYGKKHGWQVKFTHERRALLYLVPHEGSFLAGMALRPGAVERLGDAGLPDEVVAGILAEKAYPEGQPARTEVTGPEKLPIVESLIDLKLATT
jgi:hypothetical protein